MSCCAWNCQSLCGSMPAVCTQACTTTMFCLPDTSSAHKDVQTCDVSVAVLFFVMPLQAAFAPADPPPVEEVPPDAVDSAGKPVDSTLYTAFWKLQVCIGMHALLW